MLSRRLLTALLIAALGLTAAFFSGCTCHPNEEQLQALRELKQKERDLSTQISKTEREIGNLRGEMNAVQKDLDKCKDDKAFVNKHLPNWPNIWPSDIRFEEPKEETPEEEGK